MNPSSAVTFYTDGGALFPADPDARISSWAVVADTVCPSVPQIQMLSSYIGDTNRFPVFQVVGCGLVFGHQSSSRGELIAFWKALVAASSLDESLSVDIVTDASYVVFVDWALRNDLPGFPSHKTRNRDVIVSIAQVWSSRVRVHKTKSHRKPDQASDWEDLWGLYGNQMADFVAAASLKAIPSAFLDLFRQIAAFHRDEAVMLKQVLAYVADLNRTRDQTGKGVTEDGRCLKETFRGTVIPKDGILFLTTPFDRRILPRE